MNTERERKEVKENSVREIYQNFTALQGLKFYAINFSKPSVFANLDYTMQTEKRSGGGGGEGSEVK